MYLEIDEGYFEHPKTLRLCAALRDHHAAIYPIRLWKWACRSARDGKLGKVDSFVIEKVVGYEPMDGRCFVALCEGFLDVSGDEVEIHDWMQRTGGAIKRMDDKAAENKRRREEGKRKYAEAKSAEQHQDDSTPVPESYRNRTGTNPTQTRQDQSSPDQSSDLHTGRDGLELFCTEPTKDKAADDIRAVFAHYRKRHPKAFRDPQPGTKEWRLIRDRMREGSTVEELCLCIDGYHRSPHHLGQNERNTKYLDLELFVRDGSHVARGIELASEKTKHEPRWGGSELLVR
jgi:hypothetical protein